MTFQMPGSRNFSPFTTTTRRTDSRLPSRGAPVPAAHISIQISGQNVLPIIFPPGSQAKLDVKRAIYDELLRRLQEKNIRYEERECVGTVNGHKPSGVHPTRVP